MSKLRHSGKSAKSSKTVPKGAKGYNPTDAELRKLDKPATLPRGKGGGRKPSRATKMK